jgi:Ion channel
MAKAKSKKKTFPRQVKKEEESADNADNEEEDLDLLPPSPDSKMLLSSSRIIMMGMSLVGIGMLGFYYIPGLMAAPAEDDNDPTKGGDRWVNAFYCSVITLTTIGFGDICPANPDLMGRTFLTILPLLGLGFFCGPILNMSSSWTSQVPGGILSLAVVTIALGVSALTALEGMSISDAIHLTIITGETFYAGLDGGTMLCLH